MTNEKLIELLERFKSGLLAVATDGSFDDKEYAEIRKVLMSTDFIKSVLPSFVRIYRTPIEFRRFMQAEYDHYKERRKFITDEINKVIIFIEEYSGSQVPNNMSVLEKEERVGYGGFGEVYKYHHDILNMDFAIKFFSPIFAIPDEQSEGEKRFFREAKILFELHNDHIVQIYDAGYLDGKPFIRMEFINGYDMNKLLEKYSLIPFQKSLTAINEILNGLKYAHKKGIIHRDLKPSNVMFSLSEKCFKIIDFGISAFMDVDSHTKLTKTGEQIAGGLYIDPQLQENPRLRDLRSDIYSVGAIWFYLLTGNAPSGSDMKQRLIMEAKLNEEEANVIMKCLASKLEDRYSSCEELQKVVLDLKRK